MKAVIISLALLGIAFALPQQTAEEYYPNDDGVDHASLGHKVKPREAEKYYPNDDGVDHASLGHKVKPREAEEYYPNDDGIDHASLGHKVKPLEGAASSKENVKVEGNSMPFYTGYLGYPGIGYGGYPYRGGLGWGR